jgi:hypothetical protein
MITCALWPICLWFLFYFQFCKFCKFYHRMPMTFWLMQNDCHQPTWVLWTNHHTCLISTWTSSHFLSPDYFLSLTCFANLCSSKPVWKSEIRRENNKSLLRKNKTLQKASFLPWLRSHPDSRPEVFFISCYGVCPPHTHESLEGTWSGTISSTHAWYPLYPMPTKLFASLLSSLDCLL